MQEATNSNERRLKPASQVWNRYEITSRTGDRWLANPSLNFPKPLVINGRRYFYEDELVAWERSRAAARSTEAA
jgi:hypothetical protein